MNHLEWPAPHGVRQMIGDDENAEMEGGRCRYPGRARDVRRRARETIRQRARTKRVNAAREAPQPNVRNCAGQAEL
jgi:hypothetical protein